MQVDLVLEKESFATYKFLRLPSFIHSFSNTNPLSAKEKLVCELLQELDPDKLMDSDIVHPRLLKELDDIFMRLLSKPLCSGGDQKTRRWLVSYYLSYNLKKRLKEDQGNYRPISLHQSLGKLWNGSSGSHPKSDEEFDWENSAQIQQGQILLDEHDCLP